MKNSILSFQFVFEFRVSPDMKLTNLIAATYTPFCPRSGEVNLDLIGEMADFMIARGSSGFYVCGSTGEGESLSEEERKQVAESFVTAAKGRVPVIVQVGHNSISSCRKLAEHAEEIGADAISTLPPMYYKPPTLGALVDYIEKVTEAAPGIPYYYYHIPMLSGVNFDMVELLQLVSDRIPSFNGIKFSYQDLSQMMACHEVEGGRFDIPFGSDQMMLGALACGAKGAVGSCYGFAGPLWLKIIESFQNGDLELAQRWMRKANRMVRMITTVPGPFHASVKQVVWPLHGFDPGPLRLPQPRLNESQIDLARRTLEESGLAAEIASGDFSLE